MTPAEHRAAAERLLEDADATTNRPEATLLAALAQVHATLALTTDRETQ
jgi:hypothetical protein